MYDRVKPGAISIVITPRFLIVIKYGDGIKLERSEITDIQSIGTSIAFIYTRPSGVLLNTSRWEIFLFLTRLLSAKKTFFINK